MANKDIRFNESADLRRKAEALDRGRVDKTSQDIAALSPEKIRETLHELRVHQIELELQNEELRMAQVKIEAGRARYFDLYDLAPVGYCTLSEQGLIQEANLTAAALLDTARGALIKQPLSRFIRKEDQDIYYLHRKKLFETGEPQECELRLVRPDGAHIWAHLTATTAQAEDGAPVCRFVLSNITGQKQAEQKIIEQKDLLAAIYRNAPLVMMVVNAERRIQQINGFTAQFANRDAEEMLGLRGGEALRCLHAIDDPRGCEFGEFCRQCVIRNTVLDTIETGEMHLQLEAPYYFRGQDDETREMTLLMSTTPIDVRGERMVLVTLLDITERKQAEAETEKLQAQLRQAQKMEAVGRLAGGVAHDFNNMLSVIIGNAELAIESMAPNDPLHNNLNEIFSAARRSADITRQLLAFARKQTIAPKVLDLNKTIERVLKMLRRLIGEDIDLAWLPEAKIWPVRMDPAQIDQILANLCVNARDAIADVGRITIETGTTAFDEAYCARHPGFVPGDFVLLAVSDDGCGMDRQTLDNLFEPFFTTKDMDKGTGLGLATVYGIVKQNNGFINVYSEPNQGTTFKIYLPRHQAGTQVKAHAETAKPTTRGSETILLVEDEPSILRMTRIMLERMGYRVLAAGTPGEAIALAREHAGEIDLLMTDVVMPEMNGRDLAKNLLSLYPDLKRLFMSGYTANVIAHHGVLDEGVQFIQKPFAKQDLAIKVREVLDEAKEANQQ